MIDDLKLSGTNAISVTDSLQAPLLKLSVKNGASTTVSTSNDLYIYVDKGEVETAEKRAYLFELTAPLAIVGDVSDEFIIEPIIENSKVKLNAYVIRNISEGVVLAEPILEPVENNVIMLFEGVNYIYTNYTNSIINIVYPKNTDLVTYFLNTTLAAVNMDGKLLTLEDIYFKDCFTEMDEGINANFNKATIKCLDSQNNKFSLDCDGNLVVNSITSTVPVASSVSLTEVYPVGSVYLSVNATNPGTLFGGAWEQITGYYLYAGIGGTVAGSNTSGTPSTNETGATTLTVSQMPSHTHVQNAHNHEQHAYTWYNDQTRYDVRLATTSGGYYAAANDGYYTTSTTATNQYTGGGQAHSHTLSSHTHGVTPLRYEVYMWKRVS